MYTPGFALARASHLHFFQSTKLTVFLNNMVDSFSFKTYLPIPANSDIEYSTFSRGET